MAKGMPNDEDLKLNFVAKVWDQVAEEYRPIYIAPDSTDEVRGDVYLTDIPNEEDTAALGVTAISPKGVYDVQQNLQEQITSLKTDTDQNNSSLTEQVEDNARSIEQLTTQIQEYLPPVGTIYRTASTTDPATIWGGSWMKESDRHDLQGFYIWTRIS